MVSYVKPINANATVRMTDTAVIVSLKQQLMQARKENKQLQEEMDEMRKSAKVCVFNELDAQVEVYSDECVRLRSLLEKSHKRC